MKKQIEEKNRINEKEKNELIRIKSIQKGIEMENTLISKDLKETKEKMMEKDTIIKENEEQKNEMKKE